jgi:5'-nucleotidase
MRILLTNDDGVHAPGIRVLKECLSSFADVWVVAPLEERSTTGHTVTLNDTLRLVEIDEKVFGCSGYPADCFLLAKGHLFKKSKIDLVISGINRGANLGQDVFYSGTVAAAREATFHQVPSIAISSVAEFVNPSQEIRYFTAGHFLNKLILGGIAKNIGMGELLNINVPNLDIDKVKGIEAANPGRRIYSDDIDERVDCRGRTYFWIGGTYRGHDQRQGTDCTIVDSGKIAVTPFHYTGHMSERMQFWNDYLRGFVLA